MIRHFLIILFSIALTLPVFAQNEQKADEIRNNPDYYYGEGHGETEADADRAALSNLLSKISTQVNTNFSQIKEEKSHDGEINSSSVSKMVIDTYSEGHLTNTGSITLKGAPNAHVMRYITKDELNKIYKQREDKVLETVRNAVRYEKNLKIGDALRNYYWAHALLKSLQYYNDVTYTDSEGTHKLMLWIPEQIEDILDEIKVEITEYDEGSATLFFTYKGEPVKNLEFSFWNGRSQSMCIGAKNGIATIDFPPTSDVQSFRIKYEIEAEGQTAMDPDFAGVVALFQAPYFKNSEVKLCADATSLKNAVSKKAKKQMELAIEEAASTNAIETVSNTKQYDKVMKDIFNSVKKGNYAPIKDYFTPEGWNMMDKLLHYGKAKMLNQQEFSYYDLGAGRTVCRSLVMSFTFPNNHRTFTEDVTFTFNSDNLIETVAFGLGIEAKTDIFNKGFDIDGNKIWDDKSKLAIATFLENYKTAFALKRLDYLNDIFDDNAVIITGTVIKKAPQLNDNGSMSMGKDIVKYNKFNKSQYLEKMERSFKSNEFINIRFTDNDVQWMANEAEGQVFGIQIHQDYFSSTYGDTGYLFLMVDVNDPDQPVIKVRTWQPERDPNLNNRIRPDHPDFGLIGPWSF